MRVTCARCACVHNSHGPFAARQEERRRVSGAVRFRSPSLQDANVRASTMVGLEEAQGTSCTSLPLPQAIIDDSFKRGALKYKTRGLTSSIHTYDLQRAVDQGRVGVSDAQEVQVTLENLSASSSLLIVKSIDLEEQPKPHDVEKEIQLLCRCNEAGDERAQYIVRLLATATEEPDDFTRIIRLYLPHYPLTLSDWLYDDASRMPPTETQLHLNAGHTIAQQLYSALAFLDSLGISHRDIKPSNVLLTTSDATSSASFLLKLCDFGTATDEDRPLTCSTSTHPYTPPELLFSPKKGYDGGKVDVWQAACVVAEIFGEREALGGEGNGGSRQRPLPTAGENQDDDDDDDPFADDTPNWQHLQRTLFSTDPGADAAWLERGTLSAPPPPQQQQPSPIARQHRTLFPRSKPSMGGNDLALASAHFDFCGLPDADQVQLWPEAVDYQPSLERMPFPRRLAPKQPEEMRRRCVLLAGDDVKVQAILDVLLGSLQLSQGRRWNASMAVERLCGGAVP